MQNLLSLPILLPGSLILLAALAYIFRNWERTVALVAAGYCAGWALLLWLADLSMPVWTPPLLGRGIDLTASVSYFDFTLQLTAVAAPIIALALAIAAAGFALTARASQGWTFTPMTLALVAGYVLLLLLAAGPVSPILMAPLLLAALSTLAVFIVQAGRIENPAGALRMLVPPLLAFPIVLIANWYLDQAYLDPQNTQLFQTAAQFVALGYVILLAPTPLHGAQPGMAQSAPPVATAVVGLLYQLAALFMLFQVLTQLPFVAQNAPLALLLDWAGLVTAIWGGATAFGTLNAGRLWGYAALHDWGLILMVLALAGTRSLPLALFLFTLRAISMLTAATGLAVLEARAGGLTALQLKGAGNRLPWNSAAYLLGGLGLAGFPLSAGFTGHWAALQIIAENDWRPAAAVLLASSGAIFSYIRLARILFSPLENRSLRRERVWSAVVAAGILLFSIGLALAPQLLDGPISRMLLAFSS